MRMYNKLIWEDDFDGSELDMTKWSFRTGNWQVAPDGTPVVAGWGPQELQYYTPGGKNIKNIPTHPGGPPRCPPPPGWIFMGRNRIFSRSP